MPEFQILMFILRLVQMIPTLKKHVKEFIRVLNWRRKNSHKMPWRFHRFITELSEERLREDMDEDLIEVFYFHLDKGVHEEDAKVAAYRYLSRAFRIAKAVSETEQMQDKVAAYERKYETTVIDDALKMQDFIGLKVV